MLDIYKCCAFPSVLPGGVQMWDILTLASFDIIYYLGQSRSALFGVSYIQSIIEASGSNKAYLPHPLFSAYTSTIPFSTLLNHEGYSLHNRSVFSICSSMIKFPAIYTSSKLQSTIILSRFSISSTVIFFFLSLARETEQEIKFFIYSNESVSFPFQNTGLNRPVGHLEDASTTQKVIGCKFRQL